jgi:hypothetical protein
VETWRTSACGFGELMQVLLSSRRYSDPCRLQEAGVLLPPDPAAGQPVLESIDRTELPQILGAVLSESFGLWLGMSEDEVRVAARERSNVDRALALTPEARFVILSLYDENFEVLARGMSDLELAAEVDHALESVPIEKL